MPSSTQNSSFVPFTPTLPAGYVLRDYIIEDMLGQGGFGITYRAREEMTDYPVVIKENYPSDFAYRDPTTGELRPKHDKDDDYQWALKSFEKEARTLRKLPIHPNIVHVTGVIRALNTAYIVMEPVSGQNLHKLYTGTSGTTGRQMEAQLLESILRKLLSALISMHSREIIHRDIKPANIMLTPAGEPVLIDFGAARPIQGTHHATQIGTREYAPPEQMEQADDEDGEKQPPQPQPHWDLYALGCTCHQLITGRAPIHGSRQLTGRTELAGKYPARLLSSIDKAREIDPANRWQSAQDWLDELTADERAAQEEARRRQAEAEANTRNELAQLRTALADALEHGQQTESKLKSAEKALQITETTAANLQRQLKNAAQGNTGKRRSYGGCLIISLLLLAASGALNYHQYQYAESLSTQTENVNNELMQAEEKVRKTEEAQQSAEKKAAESDEKANKAEEAADAQYRKGLSFYEQRDYTKAVEWFQKAAEQGHAIAQCYLGVCYERGRGVQQDYTKAVEWFQKAAEQGDAAAQFNLGVCYYYGRGVQQDYTKAVEWYKKAAEQGDAGAQCNLGVCYENGHGVQQDYTKAVEWYKKAANQGHAIAQCNLGVCYYYGLGVQQDHTKAVEWYKKAAEQGDAFAQCNLGVCYERGHGVQQDYTKAVEWYKKAANQGYADAQYHLGFCYEKGRGVQQDYTKAVEWYKKAANQGNATAQFNLGNCYYYGHGVQQDYTKAVEWFQKAAEQGYATAQCNLGFCYENGHGVQQDYTKAVEWYKKAANQGQVNAQYNLGHCYEYGLGVQKNIAQAIKWYRKASQQGNEAAGAALKRLKR